MRKYLLLWVAVWALAIGGSSAFGFSIDSMGVLPNYPGGTDTGGVMNCYASYARGLSPDGQYAVGYSQGDIYWNGVPYETNVPIPVYWSKATGLVRQHEDWRHGGWTGVGQSGKIAGTISDRARYDTIGVDVENDLPPIPIGGNTQCAVAFSNAVSGNDHWMVGYGVRNYANKAIRWDSSVYPIPLNAYVTRQGVGASGFGGVANSGACVGTDRHGTGGGDGAIYWDGASAGVTNIPALAGNVATQGQGIGISDNGTYTTGYLSKDAGGYNGFRWSPSDASSMALVPFGSDTLSWGGDAADNGMVAGWTYNPTNSYRVCVWDSDGTPQLLYDFLVSLGVDMSGWQRLTKAYSITPDGKYISGYGLTTAGREEGFVAFIPEPATMLLLALGGLALRRRR